MNKPLVKNAASEHQQNEAKKKLIISRQTELNDLRTILSSKEGRRILWRFLSHAGVFNSIWDNSARIHYNAGKQDFGHFIQSEIVEADQEAYFLMMKEAKEAEQ